MRYYACLYYDDINDVLIIVQVSIIVHPTETFLLLKPAKGRSKHFEEKGRGGLRALLRPRFYPASSKYCVVYSRSIKPPRRRYNCSYVELIPTISTASILFYISNTVLK